MLTCFVLSGVLIKLKFTLRIDDNVETDRSFFEHCQLLKVYTGQNLRAIYTLLDKELFLVDTFRICFLSTLKSGDLQY